MDAEAYLLQKGLRTFDPYAQEDLLPLDRQIPDRNSLEIRNRYIVGSKKIFCHICGSRRHHNGFTGVVSDGSAILFGNTCARDYFCEEALSCAQLAFEHQEQLAYAEFTVRRLQGTASEMRRWLQKHHSTVKSISDAWDLLLAEHGPTFTELFTHLEKNNQRLTEDFEEEASDISRSVGRIDRVVSRRVVCAVRNFASIKTIREFRNHHRIVSTLPSVLLELDSSATKAALLELSEKLRTNFFPSLDEFEAVIRLSVELFSEPTFSQICHWSDRQRILRLRQADRVSPRDLARTLRRKLGDGYELPRPMLREVVAADEFLIGERTGARGSSGQARG